MTVVAARMEGVKSPRTAVTAGGVIHQEVSPVSERNDIPYGYCHCGCGQKTQINTHNDASKGWIAGHPRSYIRGHHLQRPRTMAERFWEKVAVGEPDECWEWQASIYPATGYGMFWNGEKPSTAQRAAIVLDGREIPEGHVVDHLCRNRRCVNPRHLEVISGERNTLRGWVSRYGHLCCEDCQKRLREAM